MPLPAHQIIFAAPFENSVADGLNRIIRHFKPVPGLCNIFYLSGMAE
jgi:hypothetical protein